MHVPLVDLPIQYRSLRSELLSAIENVLESGQLFLGPHTRAFEEEYAAYCGARFAVALGNAPRSAEVMAALNARREDASALVREHVAWALARHASVNAPSDYR